MKTLPLGQMAFSILLAALAIALFFMVRPHVDSSLLLPAAAFLGIAAGMMLARNTASVLFASIGLLAAVFAIWPELPKPMNPWDNPNDCSGCQEIGYLIGVPVYFGFYAFAFGGLILLSLVPFSMHVFFKQGTAASLSKAGGENRPLKPDNSRSTDSIRSEKTYSNLKVIDSSKRTRSVARVVTTEMSISEGDVAEEAGTATVRSAIKDIFNRTDSNA